MIQFIVLIVFIAGTGISYGQHTEFSLQAGSGLFAFSGPGSAKETGLLVTDYSFSQSISNPYGRNSGFSYGLTTQAQHITENQLIYGIQAGYEMLTSRVAITSVSGCYCFPTTATVDGRATLQNKFVILSPLVGKRFGSERVSLDATIGLDMGFGLTAHEHGEILGSMGYYTVTNRNRPIPTVDFRPRLNLTGYYRAFGLSLGYSHGLTNYTAGSFNAAAYSRLWRIGLVYRLVKRA